MIHQDNENTAGPTPENNGHSSIADQGKTNAFLIIENERIIYASPLYLRMMGYHEDESLSEKDDLRKNIHPDDKPELDRIVKEALKNKTNTLRYTFREKTRKGNYIVREDYARFQYDASGKHVRTYVVCREIPSKNGQTGTDNAHNQSLCKVLIAEDNRLNMMIVKDQLKHLLPDCLIFEAWDGKQAVSLFQEHTPDMVLMDIHMPGKDGYEATKEIRKTEHALNLQRRPIIAITARTQKGEKQRCLDAGMDDYLPKPLQENDFVATISKHMDPDKRTKT